MVYSSVAELKSGARSLYSAILTRLPLVPPFHFRIVPDTPSCWTPRLPWLYTASETATCYLAPFLAGLFFYSDLTRSPQPLWVLQLHLIGDPDHVMPQTAPDSMLAHPPPSVLLGATTSSL